MKKIRIPFLVVALSLTVTGMAFALDIPNISSWTQSMGVGGGGPGRGDVLIGALYDVRDITDPNIPAISNPGIQHQATLLSIVNTDPIYGVVARLRFREWKRSHECLDIDIPLSSNDVWVAELDNILGVPTLFSSDYWISDALYGGLDPPTPASPFTATPLSFDFPNGLPFLPSGVVPSVWGESTITYAQAIARCQYGYFEVIGEERFLTVKKPTPPATWEIDRMTLPCANPTFDCRDVDDVLMGSVYILRADQGMSHQYNMNAISDFAVDSKGIWATTGGPSPNLRDQVQGELLPGAIAPNPGIGGINQLEAILSKRFVFFQYVNGIQGTTPMSTSVVLTLPTKWFHYTGSSGGFANITTNWPYGPPFTGSFETRDDSSTTGGEICNVQIYDRDEHIFSTPGTTPVSPSEPLQPGLPHCPWEVNVFGLIPHDPASVDFRNNVAIATANAISGQTFTSGWGWIDLSPNLKFVSSDNRAVSQGEGSLASPITFNFFNNIFPGGPMMPPSPGTFPGAYRGLPGIGIVMTEFFNDSIGAGAYYGNTVPWQYAVDFGDIPCATLPPTFVCGSGLPPDGTAFPGGTGY
jgi:hypothetical protein